MTILTIRTDKPEAEIGLFDGEKKLAYQTWQAHRQLAETIHSQIAKILQSAGKNQNDIDGIVIYKGPGSFTGLRIGMSVANALAYSFGLPIVATAGRDWIKAGIKKLEKGQGEKSVQPDYGAPARITQPKK